MTSQSSAASDSLTVTVTSADIPLTSDDGHGALSGPVMTGHRDQSRPVTTGPVTEEWLTLAEAVAATGTSESTIRRRLRTGAFPHAEREPVGNGWRIPRADLEAAGLLDGVHDGVVDDDGGEVVGGAAEVQVVEEAELDDLGGLLERLGVLQDEVQALRAAQDERADLLARVARAEAQAEERAAALVRADRTVELLEGTVTALNGRLSELGEAVAALASTQERRPMLLQHLVDRDDESGEVHADLMGAGVAEREAEDQADVQDDPGLPGHDPVEMSEQDKPGPAGPVGRLRRWLSRR